MSKHKHTPGPWWMLWAEAHKSYIVKGHEGLIASVWCGRTDRAKHNARLIAEAPTMRYLLETAVDAGTDIEWIRQARVLLKQIKGGDDA